MGRLGFEPRTIRLKAEYSTIELATLILLFKRQYYSTFNFYKFLFLLFIFINLVKFLI